MTSQHAETFGTAVTCVDGRVQQPVAEWVRKNYHVQFVDMITEPGPDKEFSAVASAVIEAGRKKVAISVERHNSSVIVIAGHHQCAANPVSAEQHKAEIKKAAQMLTNWKFPVPIIGLWVNDKWQIEEVVTIPWKK